MRLTEHMILARSKQSDLRTIKRINLWGCELTDISIVRDMPNIEILALSVNNLSCLQPLACCTKLQELYLRKNNIQDFNQLSHLQNLPRLTHLWLAENPCCVYAGNNYRAWVVRMLPNLKKLDEEMVTSADIENSKKFTVPSAEPERTIHKIPVAVGTQEQINEPQPQPQPQPHPQPQPLIPSANVQQPYAASPQSLQQIDTPMQSQDLSLLQEQFPVSVRSKMMQEQPPITARSNIIQEQPPITARSNMMQEQSPITARSKMMHEQCPITARSKVMQEQSPISFLSKMMQQENTQSSIIDSQELISFSPEKQVGPVLVESTLKQQNSQSATPNKPSHIEEFELRKQSKSSERSYTTAALPPEKPRENIIPPIPFTARSDNVQLQEQESQRLNRSRSLSPFPHLNLVVHINQPRRGPEVPLNLNNSSSMQTINECAEHDGEQQNSRFQYGGAGDETARSRCDVYWDDGSRTSRSAVLEAQPHETDTEYASRVSMARRSLGNQRFPGSNNVPQTPRSRYSMDVNTDMCSEDGLRGDHTARSSATYTSQTTRRLNENVLTALLCIVPELDIDSLQVLEHSVECRINELSME